MSLVAEGLTSTAIAVQKDKNYSWTDSSLLIPHEAIRREFMRAEGAIKNMDVVKYPWHIVCFHEWSTNFFHRAVHAHHESEEQCLIPGYHKKGIEVPQSHLDDHKSLVDDIIKCEDLSSKLLSLVKKHQENPSSVNLDDIKNTQDELKHNYLAMKELMIEHMKEEELFWPHKIEPYGEKYLNEIVQEILAHGQHLKGQDGEAFKLFAISIFSSMGAYTGSIKNCTPSKLTIEGWGSKEVILTHYTHNLPFFVRWFIVPSWNKRYHRYRMMIESVWGDENILQMKV